MTTQVETSLQVVEDEVRAVGESLSTEINPIVDAAHEIEVADSVGAETATEFLAQIAAQAKTVEAERLKIKKPITDAGTACDTTFKKLSSPLKQAREIVQNKLVAWRAVEAARIAAEQAAEAKRIAEEQRIENERVAELQRLENERVAAEKAKAEAELAAAEAKAAVAERDEAVAEEVETALENAIAAEDLVAKEIVPVEIVPEVQPQAKTIEADSGKVSFRTVWEHEVTDLGMVPRTYMVVDKRLLNEAVKAGERDIPGVRIFSREVPVVRA